VRSALLSNCGPIFLTESRKVIHNLTVQVTFDTEPLLRGAAARVSPTLAAWRSAPVDHEYAIDVAEVRYWDLCPI
jgi:hypothetical protein